MTSLIYSRQSTTIMNTQYDIGLKTETESSLQSRKSNISIGHVSSSNS